MLVGHLGWLLRGDFVGQFVETGGGLAGGALMAWVDWPAAVDALEAGQLPCSSGEGQVLRIAASIAGGVLIDLSQAVSGLDDANIVLAARAILHAAGHREAGVMVAEAGR